METELRAFLRADAGVAALVGTRVEWGVRPQTSALPAITLHLISAPRGYTMTGRDNKIGALVQIDCWGLTFKAAKDVADAVAAALERPLSNPLRAVFIENERADLDPGSDGSPDIYRASLDVRVWATA